MHNWDYKIDDKKTIPTLWKLERLINYGLGDQKIEMDELKDNWDKINIDPQKREFLKLFL